MPDRDGISFSFPGGGVFCHGCDRWIGTGDIGKHRRSCGRRWRDMFGARRGPSRDEQLAAKAIAIVEEE